MRLAGLSRQSGTGQSFEHVLEIAVRIVTVEFGGLDQTHGDGCAAPRHARSPRTTSYEIRPGRPIRRDRAAHWGTAVVADAASADRRRLLRRLVTGPLF